MKAEVWKQLDNVMFRQSGSPYPSLNLRILDGDKTRRASVRLLDFLAELDWKQIADGRREAIMEDQSDFDATAKELKETTAKLDDPIQRWDKVHAAHEADRLTEQLNQCAERKQRNQRLLELAEQWGKAFA